MAPDSYEAAVGNVALIRRPGLRFYEVVGRSPEAMLTGILSGSMPPAGRPTPGGGRRGRMPSSGILTPKGHLVSDSRVARLEEAEGGALLLELPEAAAEAALDHFRQYLPPRLARVVPPEEPLAAVSVVGPATAELLAATLPWATVAELDDMEEGDAWWHGRNGPPDLLVVRNGEVTPLAFDLIAGETRLASLVATFRGRGVPEGSADLWEILRVERGRPAFGVEMDGDTLPQEAGIEARTVDYGKGCFTGQEVLVRIRDRGHVNRHLRGLLFGAGPPPPRGTPLYRHGSEQPAGEVRSAIRSPGFGQAIGLGYVRREVEPRATLRAGSPGGPDVGLRAIDSSGWVLVEGDPGFNP